MLTGLQPVGNNMSMHLGQSMENSTEPALETLALSYNKNELADPDLWDGLFTPISLLGINEFIGNNAQNITCSLL